LKEFPKDDQVSATFDRLERERDDAYEQRDQYYDLLEDERDKRRFTRRLEDLLREFGLW
jgi:hypothetical protein